ncbi:toprim domain-containing protein [Cytobacillus sp. Hm23]
MSKILSSYSIEIEDLIGDLRYLWMKTDNRYNTYAFTKARKSGGNIMFCCPFHEETNPSAGLRLDYPYTFNCFGCNHSTNLQQLITYVVGFNSELQGEHLLKNYIKTSMEERKPINIERILDDRGQDRKVGLHEQDINKYFGKRPAYLYNRGFNDRTLNKYEIGFDQETNSITFPIRTSRGDIRFIKRRFISKKKFLNKSGIDKKDIVYGLYYINQSPKIVEEIFLNESETDTLSCYQAGIPAGALLGSTLFKDQVFELLKSGMKTVNLFFDNDKQGVECTIKSYFLLSRLTPFRVNTVIYPNGHFGIDEVETTIYKDANDLLIAGKLKDIDLIPAEEFIDMIYDAEAININLITI